MVTHPSSETVPVKSDPLMEMSPLSDSTLAFFTSNSCSPAPQSMLTVMSWSVAPSTKETCAAMPLLFALAGTLVWNLMSCSSCACTAAELHSIAISSRKTDGRKVNFFFIRFGK